jgi:hypothetical protein
MANTRRENRLEELGRVDAEKAYTSKGKRNLREEKHRIRGELKKGGKVKNGLSPAQSHYLQHGYGPHKRDRKAVGGVIKAAKKVAKKVAKTVAAPGTHIRNVASGIKHGATKLIKGLPKIAKRGWK